MREMKHMLVCISRFQCSVMLLYGCMVGRCAHLCIPTYAQLIRSSFIRVCDGSHRARRQLNRC